MRTKFYTLIDAALSEIIRRDETYASRFPLILNSPAALAEKYLTHPNCASLAAGDLERALEDGFAYLAKSWPAGSRASEDGDPLSEIFAATIVDAHCANEGILPLAAGGYDPERTARDALKRDYNELRLANGQRYFIRERGTKPLFLINAAGVPIDVWRRFLGDPSHDFKIVVAERASGDLFAGGLQRNVVIADEAENFAAILEQEHVEDVTVLAWCNGARVAVDLAGRCPERISSLVLVAPTLRSKIKSLDTKPCPFEIGLHPVLEAVAARPELAPILAQTISQQAQSPDWNSLTDSPTRRAEALFRLPPKDIAPGLMAPLATGDSLLTLARQVPADEAYPIADALARLRARLMLILGRHDQIVSDAFTRSLMRPSQHPVEAVIEGAGHYIHDLEYPYFRMSLAAFLDGRDPPASARAALSGLAARHGLPPAEKRRPARLEAKAAS